MKKVIIILVVCLFTWQNVCFSEVTLKPPDSTKQKNDTSQSSGSGIGSTGTGSTGAGTGSTPDKCINNPLYGIKNDDLLGIRDEACLEPGIEKTFTYQNLIPYIIKRLLEIGSGIAVLMLVYSGILFLAMGSEEEMRTKAIKNIMYSLTGLAVMILSRAIVSIVENLPLA